VHHTGTNDIVVLIPAYNEQDSIAATIRAMLKQDRAPDRIVVIPNGCTDRTATIARQFPVTVLELPKLAHKKSEALNTAWKQYGSNADIVICLDADTILPNDAVGNWEAEFTNDFERRMTGRNPAVSWTNSRPRPESRGRHRVQPSPRSTEGVHSLPLGGSSSKFTMRGGDFLTRLQRFEFARWTDTALRRGWTSVLAGTGCAISGEALRMVAAGDDRDGPWTYSSQVEDFELTYAIRRLGYRCQVSPLVRAYTDSMKTVKSLLGQRMKWEVGTIEDLCSIGLNRLTCLDWWQQVAGTWQC
jgi:cellulose synthase/poly-beta-1,6-N-acetylglucosamine synthase-like glycosyltransferase